MGLPKSLCLTDVTLATPSVFQNFSEPWREHPAVEYNTFPAPPDYREKTEFVFARLMYPNASFGRGFGRRFGDWSQGGPGAFWTMDYPRSYRHHLLPMRRLSRIHARSVEQTIDLDENGHYDGPWLDADDPEYPRKFSALGTRIAATYAMTH